MYSTVKLNKIILTGVDKSCPHVKTVYFYLLFFWWGICLGQLLYDYVFTSSVPDCKFIEGHVLRTNVQNNAKLTEKRVHYYKEYTCPYYCRQVLRKFGQTLVSEQIYSNCTAVL
jgi:hypothetical protein